jgi:hypothetical protein
MEIHSVVFSAVRSVTRGSSDVAQPLSTVRPPSFQGTSTGWTITQRKAFHLSRIRVPMISSISGLEASSERRTNQFRTTTWAKGRAVDNGPHDKSHQPVNGLDFLGRYHYDYRMDRPKGSCIYPTKPTCSSWPIKTIWIHSPWKGQSGRQSKYGFIYFVHFP